MAISLIDSLNPKPYGGYTPGMRPSGYGSLGTACAAHGPLSPVRYEGLGSRELYCDDRANNSDSCMILLGRVQGLGFCCWLLGSRVSGFGFVGLHFLQLFGRTVAPGGTLIEPRM